ncbi:hypothetical protein ACU61A_15840 [Pseudonocardia sichuanensis]
MSEHSGPNHDSDCLAGHVAKAHCGCSRAAWLDELVPRAQARTELLTHLERWAREREVFETADLERACRVNVPMPTEPHLAGWEISPHLREYLRMGAGMAQSIVRQTWQGMAVRAIHMRKECTVRLAELEKQQAERPRLVNVELPDEHVVTEHWDHHGGDILERSCTCGERWTGDTSFCPGA